jgi:hypothetical protein
MVAAQVAQLTEGRDIFRRALNADLDRVRATKDELGQVMAEITRTQDEHLAEGRGATRFGARRRSEETL